MLQKISLILLGALLMANMAKAFPTDIEMRYKDSNSRATAMTDLQNAWRKVMIPIKTVGGPLTCDACKVLIGAIKDVIDSNLTVEESVLYATGLCTSIGLPEDMCYYLMQNYLTEIMYAYEQCEEEVSVSNYCGFLEGGSCVVEDEFLPVFDWNITFPSPEPPYVPPPQPDAASPKIRVLHISDTHFDKKYAEGAVSNCNEFMCCRANSLINPDHIAEYAGKYGSVNGSCDIPKLTLESLLAFASTSLQIDWVYWTGDIPPHDVWNQTKDGNVEMLLETNELVRSYFPNAYTVFPACGNHEAEPCNSFPVPAVYDDYPLDYLYTQLDAAWTQHIPTIDHSTVLKGGYYAYDVRPDLRLISLNTNYGSDGNWWLVIDSEDPTEELQWLIGQLDDAEQKNIKVHMFGHHPPGSTTYVWSRNYKSILDRYKGTIAGHFYGHTHDDEFRIIYDDEDPTLPISVGHVAPSVTTYSNLNPAFRVYTLDGDYSGTTWQVLDYDEYYLDIEKANAEGVATWELLYNAKDTYGLPDFTPNSWNDFLNRMETDDALFQTFNQHYYRKTTDLCEDKCKRDMLCNMKRSWAGYSDAECALQSS
ncbi:hypothetical protein CHUAL_003357 [Chamberlinius hualienensis]